MVSVGVTFVVCGCFEVFPKAATKAAMQKKKQICHTYSGYIIICMQILIIGERERANLVVYTTGSEFSVY